MAEPHKLVLILGGTQEALALAELLLSRSDLDIVSSLAGVTKNPVQPRGRVRSGGFGGVSGLSDYLAEENVSLVVDATHPFASQITENAVSAASIMQVPYIRLERAQWEPVKGDHWIEVANVAEAVASIPVGARVFLTLGQKDLAAFFERSDLNIFARMIEQPLMALPDNVELVLARPPFSFEEEQEFLKRNNIDFLVSKNSGGDATYAKLLAARALKIPVVVIGRPEKAAATVVTTTGEVIRFIEEKL